MRDSYGSCAGLVSVCAQCEIFIWRPCFHGPQSINEWGLPQCVTSCCQRERDSMTVCRGEGIPKMVLEVYDLQWSNVRHLN